MADSRLTREECQAIAERTMRSLDSLDAAAVLARFQIGERHVDEVATDELTGKLFRRTIHASPFGESEVTLTVGVSAEPRVVRRARRFRLLAEFIEGWRNAPQGQSTKVLNRSRS